MNNQVKYKKKIVFFLCLFFLFYSYAWSEVGQDLNSNEKMEKRGEVSLESDWNKNETVEENRKSLLEREEELKEFSEKEKREKKIQIQNITDRQREIALNIGEENSIFKNIVLEGEHPLKKKLEKEANSYLKREMTEKSIQELISHLAKYLLSKGYVTSIVSFQSGNIYEGNIKLKLQAGRIRDIYFVNRKEKTVRDKMEIEFAFPGYKNKVLNMRDLDQAVENLNTGRKENQIEIVSTEQEGYSDIIIHQRKHFGDIGFNYDNSPFEKNRRKLNLSYDGRSILPINDSLSFSYSTKLGEEQSKHKEEVYDVSYSIPYGYYKFTYGFNLMKNHNVVQGNAREIIRDSKTVKNRFKITRVLQRGKTNKLTGYIFLNQRKNNTFINGQKIKINSKTYTTAGLGLNYSDKLLGGNLYLGTQYEEGFPWLGSEGDKYTKGDLPKKEFKKYTFNVDWRRYFLIKNEDIIEYKLGFAAAYSKDILLDINKMSIGDDYTVRGFKKNSLSGEKGMYLNNTLTYHFSRKAHPVLSSFQPFVGLDMGTVRDRSKDSHESIIGFAYGIKFQKSGMYGSLLYGKALKLARNQKNEGRVISFNLGYFF
ncbi:hemolysin secretion/activation protein, ShlB/FhaC/HecB family [Fusobacterium necrophorum subsp. funduliforme]|uniref:Hemolysin secretion/activation protein, ShlB/FhaC/HecB family n=1 Tax=Fusobacterium necrophorum subsp. funduliforme TaxID=143387 RepID=A0A162IRT9_9FUSO|nr:ShlB/FhaC/HecB family hemolysin secretion/activation protein [Fusobacterium necrophorum]AYV93510.1 ShlB/FhaC/HecB family hemolysin secretion/activation protein [Fusobacterium necrophorum subsp. funduliforme]KYL04341.1 hemolysin secretion/activation protein, ShlB/FhaC/HecB family [Fusobacterium necrophorum subsp. funduliforme]KYM44889.1 hemolysin secretion/activation protein, ShlB/FhaC/HecB family [Fusobacterium necrophorum subsp. funduliforme]KYM62215.1 hemolysin secretion/activation protein